MEKTEPLIFVSIFGMGSIGQLHLVLSILVFKLRASCSKEVRAYRCKKSNCVKISGKCCTVSCNCRGIREARCFLNTVVALKSKFNSTLIFLTPNLDMA